MKLLALLVLCSRLLPSLTQGEGPQEVDCDDEDLFQAVDAALKKYNAEIQSGNQFVLDRVTEGTKMGDSETFYSFKYQIKESNCSVQSGLPWQDCDYKDAEEAATGECTATVGKRRNKFSTATQTCKITPGKGPVVTTEYTCLGCVHPIATDNPDLEPILKHAIQHFNNRTNHSHLFALREVKQAKRQVVAGLNYEVTYSIEQTNCSKKHYLFLNQDCKSFPGGDVGECRDSAYVDINQKIAEFSQSCNLYPGEDLVQPLPKHCPGCPKNIPVDSPELTEALNHSITKLNAESNHTFFFKIGTVIKATSQVVGGVKYFIEFTARETMCSKENDTELTASCETNHFGQILNCHANVYMRPWENKVHPTVTCRALEMTGMMRRPPGFSPFRSFLQHEIKGGTSVSSPFIARPQEEQDPENDRGPTHGSGSLHEKQTKHKIDHGHKHGHDQGHRFRESHGLGHGHQKQHKHHHGHGHGHGKGKHKNKDKSNGKHTDHRTEPLTSSSEDTTTSSTQTQGGTEGPTLNPPLAQPSTAVSPSGIQDSDLTGVMATTSPYAIDILDDLIPDIHVQPDSLSFKLISDFPEATPHKCPGRPWKPVSRKDPTTETTGFSDFDLLDALS
ncbi:kininogen-1 [Acomys russatus]|uniref:kininogen-1 n=1 Tax=Acomys russatus TaxID=60746 RepID=UPI0021E25B68|nr:kininogen-1 [Acomys russatus]